MRAKREQKFDADFETIIKISKRFQRSKPKLNNNFSCAGRQN